MNRLCLLTVILLITTVNPSNGQGSYAGSMKKLVGLKYKDANSIAVLKGYGYHEGSMISAIDDPETMTVDHFQKGADAVIFFSIKEDPDGDEYTIMDVLEFNSIPQGWQIKTAMCRQNEVDNVEIVALVKSSKEQFLKPVKQAWRFNRDKRKLQPLDKQGVDCISEGGD